MIDSLLDLLTENQWWAILIMFLLAVVLPIWTVLWVRERKHDYAPWIVPEIMCTFLTGVGLVLLWNLANGVLWLWAN